VFGIDEETVANHKSALKRIRQNERRRLQNRNARQSMRTQIKKARASLEGKSPDEAKKTVIGAISLIDKAASKGVIHPRAAARRVARLSKRAHKMLSAGK
jgi:small subunit ribosomal protein S20